jgi:hypothetical protein
MSATLRPFQRSLQRTLVFFARQSADVPFTQYLIPAQYLLDTCLIPGVESGTQPNKNPAFINSRR